MYATPYWLLDNIYIRFGTKLYRQIVGIPMGTIAHLLLLIYFYTATKEISWTLLTMIIKLMLSRLLKYNIGLKTLLSEGLTEPGFYGDLVYKFKKLIGSNDFLFSSEKS